MAFGFGQDKVKKLEKKYAAKMAAAAAAQRAGKMPELARLSAEARDLELEIERMKEC